MKELPKLSEYLKDLIFFKIIGIIKSEMNKELIQREKVAPNKPKPRETKARAKINFIIGSLIKIADNLKIFSLP
jgi:hypothetical protein